MSVQNLPVRLNPAEETLIAQLEGAGKNDMAERLRGTGLPTRRVEEYHYTDLKMLLKDVPELGTEAAAASAPALRIPGAFRLLSVNGVIEQAGTAPAGVVVGTAEGTALSERDDALVRLNSALTAESLTLELANDVDPVIHVDRRIEGEAAHVNDSVKIFVADGASATVVETFSGSDAAHIGNHASYITVGKGATLTHIMVDVSKSAVRHFNTAEYVIGGDANVRSLVVNSGAALSRTQIFANVQGEGTHADFGGLSLVENGYHTDITLDLTHSVPNTTSEELYKAVARDRSRAVFQGKISVGRDAQKTDAQMMSQGLLLNDGAEIFAKPELEIFADDVVCGHGSTCGDLDEDHLFYLMSRGIAKPEAQAMLVRAFVEELFDPIEDEELHEALTDITESWLARAIPEAAE